MSEPVVFANESATLEDLLIGFACDLESYAYQFGMQVADFLDRLCELEDAITMALRQAGEDSETTSRLWRYDRAVGHVRERLEWATEMVSDLPDCLR